MWVYDRESPKGQPACRPRGVKNFSAETNYYSLDTPDGPDPAPEGEISKLESEAAPLIKGLRPGRVLDPQERASLAVFAANMKFRVPSYRESAVERAKTKAPKIKQDAFPDPQTLAEDLKRAGHEVGEDMEAVERIFEEIHSDNYVFELTKNHHIEHMFNLTFKAAAILYERQWVFAWAPENKSFVTSDDPVVLSHWVYGPPSDFVGSVGFASEEASLLFPLRQDVCLAAITGEPSTRHVEFGREEVREVNVAQIRHYQRWLIGRDEALVKSLARLRA